MSNPEGGVGVVAPGEWVEGAAAVLDGDGRIVEANGPMCGWLGLPNPVHPGTLFWEQLEQRCSAWQPALASFRGEHGTFTEVRLSSPQVEGEAAARWYSLERVTLGSGCSVRVHSILPPRAELGESAWDTYLGSESARREMFIRLLQAEARLQKLTDHWPGVIFSQRPDGSFEFVSGKIEALTGVAPGQWLRQSQWFWQAVHEADAPELQQQMQRAARTGQAVTGTFRVRHLQTGRVSYVLEHRQPLMSRSGLLLGYEGMWLDTTRQTIAEKRLSSAAWKETLAVLTMGLAHDFGNIMAGIHSLSESFLEQLGEDHPFQQGLSLIKKNSMQASQLVHRIIHLHVGKTGERNYHDLNELVTELRDLVRKVVPRRIQLEVGLTPGQLPLYVDAVELRQTLINLTLNAAEAMPEKGVLRLETARHSEWLVPPHLHGVAPRLPCVSLTVRDTGTGIKARYLDAIFDPFFTTKSANKGSGLGLYNAALFVDKHQGAISVVSREGEGAEFTLWLPEADFTEAERLRGGAEAVPARRLNLLLWSPPGRVVDEMAELLRTQNYHAVTVTGVEAALAALRAGDCIYAGLVVLIEAEDVLLADWLEQLRRQYPMLKVILKPVGRDRDDLRSDLLRHADLVVSALAPDQEFLEQLRGVLQVEN